MPLTSDSICFPSRGSVKIPEGKLEWQCSRDFISSNNAAALLQELPILTEFLQKQDEAMSLFIEGLLSAVPKHNLIDVLGKDHGNIICHGKCEEAIKGGALMEGPEDAPHAPTHSAEKDVGGVVSNPQLDAHFTIATDKASLNLKMGGTHAFRTQMATGPWMRIMHRLEEWSNWWENLREPPRTSRLARIRHSGAFEAMTVTIIVIDSLFLAISADYEMANRTEPPKDFVYLSGWFFLAFYITEIILKLTIHGLFFFANSDMCWNMFDIVIIASSLVHLLHSAMGSHSMGFMRTFRIARAMKSLRLFKVITFFRDLRVMLECIYGSFLSLFWCLLLLVMIVFIFAIFYVQSLASHLVENDVSSIEQDNIEEFFGSVARSALTLFEIATGMAEAGEIFDILEPTGWVNSSVLLLLVGFFQISLINILTGLFVEKAMLCAKPERDVQLMEQRQESISRVAALRDLCDEFHIAESGIIKRESFLNGLQEPDMKFAFENEGLLIRDAEAFFDLLKSVTNEDYVDIDTFVASCMRLRGNATSIDLLDLEFKLQKSIQEIRREMRSVIRGGCRQIGERPCSIKLPEDPKRNIQGEEESGFNNRESDILASQDSVTQVRPAELNSDAFASSMMVSSDRSQTCEQRLYALKPEQRFHL